MHTAMSQRNFQRVPITTSIGRLRANLKWHARSQVWRGMMTSNLRFETVLQHRPKLIMG
jgi:hypothetical protein